MHIAHFRHLFIQPPYVSALYIRHAVGNFAAVTVINSEAVYILISERFTVAFGEVLPKIKLNACSFVQSERQRIIYGKNICIIPVFITFVSTSDRKNVIIAQRFAKTFRLVIAAHHVLMHAVDCTAAY